MRARVLEVGEVVLLRGEADEAVAEPVDAQRLGGEDEHVDAQVELVPEVSAIGEGGVSHRRGWCQP